MPHELAQYPDAAFERRPPAASGPCHFSRQSSKRPPRRRTMARRIQPILERSETRCSPDPVEKRNHQWTGGALTFRPAGGRRGPLVVSSGRLSTIPLGGARVALAGCDGVPIVASRARFICSAGSRDSGVRHSGRGARAHGRGMVIRTHAPAPDAGMPGLHFGEAGVAVALSEAIDAGLLARTELVNAFLHKALAGPLDWPDLTHGAAGQGVASLYCADRLSDAHPGPFASLRGLPHQQSTPMDHG